MKKLIFLFALLSHLCMRAQVTTGDCSGAIVLCGDLYTEESAPPGTGFEYEYTGACNQNLETMSLWYTWTVYAPGELSFIITPNDPSDDYDWGLFNITNGGCDGIGPGGTSPEVSCNSWGSFFPPNGPTGISTANGGVSNSGGPGDTNGPPFNANLNVTTGQTYALVVMNWSNSTSGYTIDFGESTASLYDQVPPEPVELTTDCLHSQFVVTFSEVVQTSSADNLDFLLSGPQGEITINNILPLNPTAALEDEYVIFPTAIITEPGTYTLTITDLSGSVIDPCGNATLGTVSIDLDVPMAFDLTSTDACNGMGGEIVVSNIIGVTGDYSILLNGVAQENLVLDSLAPGLYGVTLVDESSCVALHQVNVLNHQIGVSIPEQDSLSCDFPSVQITGVTVSPAQSATFQWFDISDGFTDINQDVIDPVITSTGNYLVVATDEDAFCSATDTISIVASELTDLQFEYQTGDACNGIGGYIEITSVSGGTQPYQYFLNDQPVEVMMPSLLNGSYAVRVLDDNGCAVEQIIDVALNELSFVINDLADLTCLNPEYDLNDIVIVPQQNVTYSFSVYENAEWIILPDTGPSLQINEEGTYMLTVTNPDNLCIYSEQFEVVSLIPDNFTFSSIVTNACNNENGSIMVTSMTNGVAPYVLWVDGIEQDDLLVEGLASGDFLLQLIDAQGCISETMVDVPNDVLQVSYQQPIDLSCVNDEITLQMPVINPSQAVNYDWFQVAANQELIALPVNGPTPTFNDAGEYVVMVTSQQTGCVVGVEITINYDNSSPIYFDAAVTTACNGMGGTAQVIAGGGLSPYSYVVDGISQSDPFFDDLNAGNVAVVVTDADECVLQSTITIPDHLIEVTIPAQDNLTCSDPELQIEGVVVMPPQDVTYAWNYYGNQGWQSMGLDIIDPVINNIGLYSLTATNPQTGCTDTEEIALYPGDLIAVDLDNLIFPNIVTANGDAKNDHWRPVFADLPTLDVMDVFHTYHLHVFNRWGQLVYESDGSDNGRWMIDDSLNEGNYYYTVEFSTYCGGYQVGKKEGWITLMR